MSMTDVSELSVEQGLRALLDWHEPEGLESVAPDLREKSPDSPGQLIPLHLQQKINED
jgi:hypothetical protein